jgi:RimJ/RimL family protein N-acetyltransferase
MFSVIAENGDFVGVCGLTSIDHINSRAEFSLYISPSEHGKGHGKAALRTLVDHAFNDLNLNCVWGETFAGNPAAKMFESVGFKKEGERRAFYYRDGEYITASLYSMLRGEQSWNGQHLV